ncbi:coiled-coil domain-containing protein 50 isoform X2 [Scleropages formosus]|uniref:Coiled-coil domain-containing protein n=1 Tax=Scleropages formosus TaxID=113540 RepID=A0A8D0CJC3_SCLFO|nr:coiled-coil domain-containing protein 50 isoform X2 [Scleropages formosus]
MADLGIDKNSLPGVKEVCRDFAVLEDHTLAYSLQEQEIENHLASNIHKSRLVQQDLQVAKRLQEEEDLRAKAHIQRQHKDIERSDNEIAQEIQEQLVRQAEQQRQQEEKDEAIARMLQEKEMKEERRRQKQLEAHYEEDYYEEKGGRKVRGEYGMREATQGVSRMDLREQELKDLEVARKLQEEELKSSQVDKRAAQVAQDEEIARLLMEEEKRVYKRSRDREKPCMDRRPEGDGKPGYEEVVRPRSRDEYYQKPRNHKAERPPSRGHDYENVDSSYLYPAAHHPSRASPGPETTYKGSYNRQ